MGGPGGLDPGLQNSRGQLAVRSDLPLAAVGLRQDTPTANLTTLPVVAGAWDGGGGPAPDASNLLPKTVRGLGNTANTTQDIQLDGGFELSGNMTLPAGYFPSGFLMAESAAGQSYMGTLGFLGDYSVIVPAGTFDLRVCLIDFGGLGASGAGGRRPQQMAFGGTILGHTEPGIAVSGNLTRDITVPAPVLRNASGTLSGLGKVPPAALDSLMVAVASPDSRTQGLASVDPRTGAFAVNVASGTYHLNVLFSEMADSDGEPEDVVRSTHLPKVATVNVPPGGTSGISATIPDLVRISGTVTQPQTVDFSADGILNLPVPAFPGQVVLSGRVTGPTGVPVAGAMVTAGTSGGLVGAPDASFGASTGTGADGRYSLTVLRGVNYTIEVEPSLTAGFGPFDSEAAPLRK